MKFAYRQYEMRPTPGQPEPFLYRPVIPVQVHGPTGTTVVLGLVDTGSDVTILPAFVLPLIGGTSDGDKPARFRGVDGHQGTAHYSQVELAVDHPDGLHRWPAKVGFLDGDTVAILGYAGFLEYFTATFDSERGRLTLKPNRDFPGTVVD